MLSVNKKGQVTIFIIIAILIVGSVIAYFMLRDDVGVEGVPSNLAPIYEAFLSCLEDETLVGIDLLGTQGGYIELPGFEPGSDYMPFSNHLDFVGNQIPYWYYVSGNNVQKEQVPSKSGMESSLGDFVAERISGCNLDSFFDEGYAITLGEAEADTNILGDSVEVSLGMNMYIEKGEDSVLVEDHNVLVKSDLGLLYDNAKIVYEEEQDRLFLETYAIDTLRLYAPVDGVELSCSPVTWNADDIFEELEEAIEQNTNFLKVKGGDYSLSKKENEYFEIDLPVESSVNVNFLNSKSWPNRFEVQPADTSILVSKPVGNQPGLGAMGFCYVPYHFVYDVFYSVLVQLNSPNSDEIFQFPVSVIVKKNVAREPLETFTTEPISSGMCDYLNTPVEISLADNFDSSSVDGRISYKCFNDVCSIGETNLGSLSENFPQCSNGFIVVDAEGYRSKNHEFSSVSGGATTVYLEKIYDLDLDLTFDGSPYSGDAIVTFISDDFSTTVLYPEMESVELSSGEWEIQVYAYRNSSIKLAETTQEHCIDVPQSGLGGLIGLEEERCFPVVVPEQIVSNVIFGGGKETYYVLEEELRDSNKIIINAESVGIPKTADELQDAYIDLENNDLEVSFK